MQQESGIFDLLINAVQLQSRLTSPDCLVFDVRHDLADHQAGLRAWQQGHIPGAIYLDHEQQLAAPRSGRNGRHPLPDFHEFSSLMRAHGLTPQSQVVVYDDSNSMFAAHLWWMLRWVGHHNVAVLDGGWQAWLAAGGDSEKGGNGTNTPEAEATQGERAAAGHPAMPLVDAQAVLRNLDTPTFTVVDARAANRFRGETEPMDPVAGHIPGALNRPNGMNMQADGHFKTSVELKAEFQALLQGRPAEQIVHQCGSGITACHNLFAMELAGLSGSVLYPGSWSEWCSDISRPVVKGP